LAPTWRSKDINKAGGIKAMGGAKLDPLFGDSQSKVEVGVAEVEKMNESGVAAYIGCYQSPVGIAATQAASKYNTPFLVDIGASDLIVSRGLKNVSPQAGFGACVDQGIALLATSTRRPAASPRRR
jgi:branched-chain amino acid transport system substrate-binding protein